MAQKITKNTTLKEVLRLPDAEAVLAKYRVPCLTCPVAKIEMDRLTLQQICQLYKIDLEGLLKELNSRG